MRWLVLASSHGSVVTAMGAQPCLVRSILFERLKSQQRCNAVTAGVGITSYPQGGHPTDHGWDQVVRRARSTRPMGGGGTPPAHFLFLFWVDTVCCRATSQQVAVCRCPVSASQTVYKETARLAPPSGPDSLLHATSPSPTHICPQAHYCYPTYLCITHKCHPQRPPSTLFSSPKQEPPNQSPPSLVSDA